MEYCFSAENLQALVKASKGDKEMLRYISDCLKSFEDYHQAIFSMEYWLKVYDYGTLEQVEYQDTLQSLDRARTACHNSLLAKVNMLNRMAAKAGVGPIYSGTVSESLPYRRQVADAVLSFVESVVSSRRRLPKRNKINLRMK